MRLLPIAAGLLLALTGAAFAQTFDTPKALLEAWYAPYMTDEFYEDETPFRSAALNALYERDQEITPEGDMGALDFDPFVDGQDYDVSKVTVAEPAISGDRAVVDVTIVNFGEPQTLTYDLVREDGGWKIDDVVSSHSEYAYRLTEIFADAAARYD